MPLTVKHPSTTLGTRYPPVQCLSKSRHWRARLVPSRDLVWGSTRTRDLDSIQQSRGPPCTPGPRCPSSLSISYSRWSFNVRNWPCQVRTAHSTAPLHFDSAIGDWYSFGLTSKIALASVASYLRQISDSEPISLTFIQFAQLFFISSQLNSEEWNL